MIQKFPISWIFFFSLNKIILKGCEEGSLRAFDFCVSTLLSTFVTYLELLSIKVLVDRTTPLIHHANTFHVLLGSVHPAVVVRSKK